MHCLAIKGAERAHSRNVTRAGAVRAAVVRARASSRVPCRAARMEGRAHARAHAAAHSLLRACVSESADPHTQAQTPAQPHTHARPLRTHQERKHSTACTVAHQAPEEPRVIAEHMFARKDELQAPSPPARAARLVRDRMRSHAARSFVRLFVCLFARPCRFSPSGWRRTRAVVCACRRYSRVLQGRGNQRYSRVGIV